MSHTTLRVIAIVAFACALGLGLAQHAQAQSTATITFARPTTYADGTQLPSTVAVTYRIYQGLKGQPKSAVPDITGTSQTITTGLQAGSEYCWQVSAIANGIESALSNEGCKAFPFSAPTAIVITVK